MEESTSAKQATVCRQCLSELGPGKQHFCTKTTRLQNIKGFVSESSPTSIQKLTAKCLKNINEPGTSDEIIRLKTSTGKNLPVSIKSKEKNIQARRELFTVENITDLQRNLNLSQRSAIKLSSDIRNSTQSRKSVEPNIKIKLKEKDNLLLQHFKTLDLRVY